MERVQARAEELILQRLESFLPHRPPPDPEPGRIAVLFFDIVLKSVRPPVVAPDGPVSSTPPIPATPAAPPARGSPHRRSGGPRRAGSR